MEPINLIKMRSPLTAAQFTWTAAIFTREEGARLVRDEAEAGMQRKGNLARERLCLRQQHVRLGFNNWLPHVTS